MNTTSTCFSIKPRPIFLWSSIWIFFSSFLSVIGNAFVVLVLGKSHSLHSNVRLLLKSFTVASCLLSVSLFSKSLYHFYIWHYGSFPMTPVQCGLMEAVWDLGSSTAATSVACIGIERIISTVWRRKFSDFDRPSAGAYFLLAMCWTNGLITPILLILLSALAHPADKLLCYCHVVFSVPPSFMYFLVPAYTGLETVTLISYLVLFRHSRAEFSNFTINTTQHSLSQRYQMLNNINTITLLMPTIIIHGMCYAIVTAVLTFLMTIVHDQNPTSDVIDYVSLLTILFSTEPLLQAGLLITRNRSYCKIALDYFPSLKQRFGTRIGGHVTTAASFHAKPVKAVGTSNRRGIIDFHVEPDRNNDLLKCIWSSKSI